MSGKSVKVFSLAQANKVVRRLSRFTAEAVEQLNTIRQRYKVEGQDVGPPLPESMLQEVEQLLRRWSAQVEKLGAHAKGYFTVDFQSPDPELLYCWSYGEKKISFVHKVWENFSHRRPLHAGVESSSRDHLKWIN